MSFFKKKKPTVESSYALAPKDTRNFVVHAEYTLCKKETFEEKQYDYRFVFYSEFDDSRGYMLEFIDQLCKSNESILGSHETGYFQYFNFNIPSGWELVKKDVWMSLE